MVTYKTNRFCAANETAFQEFCGRWGLTMSPSSDFDQRVSFRIYDRQAVLPIQFWKLLVSQLSTNQTVIVVEYALDIIGFTTRVHLLSSSGKHDIINHIAIKFKKALSEKKKKRYLGLLQGSIETAIANRPYKVIEVKN